MLNRNVTLFNEACRRCINSMKDNAKIMKLVTRYGKFTSFVLNKLRQIDISQWHHKEMNWIKLQASRFE